MLENSENNNNIYKANSTININNYKNIHIISKKKDITIKRDETLTEFPLFDIKNGFLTLGEENMVGKIIIDGNKDNVIAASNLIILVNASLTINHNVIICNHLGRIIKSPTNHFEYNSVIAATRFSVINIYGGEISNNIQEMNINKDVEDGVLPEVMEWAYSFDMRGAVMYLRNSILNFFNGKICKNKGINNSEIYSNENSTNKDHYLFQRSMGGVIYSEYFSKLNLYKGEISDNFAINNSKSNIITPKNGKITNIYAIYSCVYGSALLISESELRMYEDFIISNNTSYLNTTIKVEKNCIVKGIHSAIRGGQIYCGSSKVKINGGIIQNSNNKKNITSSIEQNEGGATSISSNTLGGGLDLISCQGVEINNLRISKCSGEIGGALCIDSSNNGIISNSEFSYNTANYGGGIYMSGDNTFLLNNIKIINNITKEGSGGGIYAYGDLTIDGEKSTISNNIAETWGGGIMVKTKTTINNCVICNNKSMKNSGGGIRVDGELYLNKAKIYKNWCNQYGGGINCPPNQLFVANKDEINNMVYNNKAEIGGDNLYPLDNSG